MSTAYNKLIQKSCVYIETLLIDKGKVHEQELVFQVRRRFGLPGIAKQHIKDLIATGRAKEEEGFIIWTK